MYRTTPCSVFLSALLIATDLVSALEWSRGTPLKAFVGNANSCPDKPPASGDKAFSSLFFDGTKNVVSAAASVPAGAKTIFYITNGFKTVQTSWDYGSLTLLRVAEPLGTGGGCISIPSLKAVPCNYVDESQHFWIQPFPGSTNAYQIVDGKINDFALKAAGGPLGFYAYSATSPDPGVVRKWCFYNAKTGGLVTSSDRYFKGPSSNLTQLVAQKQWPAIPADVPLTLLPGCLVDKAVPTPDSMDCLIARAVAWSDPSCAAKPDTAPCLLNLYAPFCADLLQNQGISGPSSDELMVACLQAVPLGPCAANPSGAACESGLFAGIKFPVDGSGRSPGAGVQARGDALLAPRVDHLLLHIFRLGQDWEQAAEDFIIGLGKSVFNMVTSTTKEMMAGNVERALILCVSLMKALKKPLAGDNVCFGVYKIQQMPLTLGYNNTIQRTGGIVGDIILILMPVADGAMAAREMNPETWSKLVGFFKAEPVAEGTIMKANSPSGVVEIHHMTEGGKIKAFAHPEDASKAMEAAEKSGFKNCMPMPGPLPRRAVRALARSLWRRVGPAIQIACTPYNYVVDDSAPSPMQAPPKSLYRVPDLKPQEGSVLDDLVAKTNDLFNKKISVPPTFEGESQMFAKRLENVQIGSPEHARIVDEFQRKYKLTVWEVDAISRLQSQTNFDVELFKSAMDKLPNYKGPVVTRIRLSDEVFDMLMSEDGGVITGSLEGEYNIQDLIKNPGLTDADGNSIGRVLETKAGLDIHGVSNSHTTFVIDAQFGKYISPATVNGRVPEIVFSDARQGRMKLLGYSATTNDKPAVFYFQNQA